MQQKNITPKIMAINPGGRYLAIAIFDGAILREWRMKSLQSDDKKKKLLKVRNILTGFIDRYHPTALAIKKLHASRSSAGLDTIAIEIRKYCQSQGMKLYSYSIAELEKALPCSTRINKKKLAESLADLYPELVQELKREKSNRNAYFVRLFEAVALGHVCLKEMIKKHNF